MSPGALIKGADRSLIGRDLGALTPSAPKVLGGIRALVDVLVLGLTNSCAPSKFLSCHSSSESSIARQMLSDHFLLSSQFWPMWSKSRQGLGQLPIGGSAISGRMEG